ncbi:hypothetical protein AAVH_08263 [Aphelenchoides avenae]|nr:hypothetical protein AAVH_08263 [Aphelenchus avenae]
MDNIIVKDVSPLGKCKWSTIILSAYEHHAPILSELESPFTDGYNAGYMRFNTDLPVPEVAQSAVALRLRGGRVYDAPQRRHGLDAGEAAGA